MRHVNAAATVGDLVKEGWVFDGVGDICPALPKLNIDLLRECVAWVERAATCSRRGDEPLWDQSTWQHYSPSSACGSAYCVAGYAVQSVGGSLPLVKLLEKLSDKQVLKELDIDPKWAREQADAVQLYSEYTDPGLVGYDGNLVEPEAEYWGEIGWSEAARALLGLTSAEAHRLFNGDNFYEDIAEIAGRIARSRGMEL